MRRLVREKSEAESALAETQDELCQLKKCGERGRLVE